MSTIEIMASMETDIIVRIIKHLSKGNIGSATWQAEKLKDLGFINEMDLGVEIEDALSISESTET